MNSAGLFCIPQDPMNLLSKKLQCTLPHCTRSHGLQSQNHTVATAETQSHGLPLSVVTAEWWCKMQDADASVLLSKMQKPCIYMYICIHVHISVFMAVYIYIYIYTHTSTFSCMNCNCSIHVITTSHQVMFASYTALIIILDTSFKHARHL